MIDLGPPPLVFPKPAIIRPARDELLRQTPDAKKAGFVYSPGVIGARRQKKYLPSTALLHFDGSNGSTTIVDSSATGSSFLTFGGSISLSTSSPKFGTASLFNNGGNAGVYLNSSTSPFVIGTGDFTIDCWFKWASGQQNIVDFRGASESFSSARPAFYCSETGIIRYYVNGANRISSTGSVSAGVWTHIALVRASGTTRMFIDGVLQGTWADSTNYGVGSNRPIIGYGQNNSSSSTDFLNGYIDEMRIVVGGAEWTADFSPPTGPYVV